MLNTLKQTGKNIGREIGRAWDTLSEGWRELLSRGSESLTHFTRQRDEIQDESEFAMFPRWSLLAGELEETAKDVLVRIEVPGMDKNDCRITIEGNLLRISGEKRFERDAHDSTYHVMERAYGEFERTIALPRNVDIDKAEASVRNGVLTIRLPKAGVARPHSLKVS
jgi:HSP20 family protein